MKRYSPIKWHQGWIEAMQLSLMMSLSCRLGIHWELEGKCWHLRQEKYKTFNRITFDYQEDNGQEQA